MVPAVSLYALLALGFVPPPVRIIGSADAQTCTAPAFWDWWERRCEVLLCAEGWTRHANICLNSRNRSANAASCPVGWGVRAVDYGAGNYSMRCVDPSPPPPPPDSDPGVKTGVNVSSSRTYFLKLSGSVEISVELTGMTTDFDCTVAGNNCTNRGGTADDSWSGTLGAGEHKIVVAPQGGGSGNYTLTVSARESSTGGSTGTRTQVTTLVDTSETNISASRTYSFTLARAAEVDVALTGLTIDFDCRVGSSVCTNRASTRDDSWSGDLAAGNHSVVVYPYDPGPGNYSVTVTATETLAFVAQPAGGGSTTVAICEEGEDGEADEDNCEDIVINDEITVTRGRSGGSES